ncbi:MAG: hypothetical protein QG597_1557, partial [Actinomycetota bacterium]|nr:hypothetical protein [Actinomycetota bacterium]
RGLELHRRGHGAAGNRRLLGERPAVGGEGFTAFFIQGKREGLSGRALADPEAGRFELYAHIVGLGEDDAQPPRLQNAKARSLGSGHSSEIGISELLEALLNPVNNKIRHLVFLLMKRQIRTFELF